MWQPKSYQSGAHEEHPLSVDLCCSLTEKQQLIVHSAKPFPERGRVPVEANLQNASGYPKTFMQSLLSLAQSSEKRSDLQKSLGGHSEAGKQE